MSVWLYIYQYTISVIYWLRQWIFIYRCFQICTPPYKGTFSTRPWLILYPFANAHWALVWFPWNVSFYMLHETYICFIHVFLMGMMGVLLLAGSHSYIRLCLKCMKHQGGTLVWSRAWNPDRSYISLRERNYHMKLLFEAYYSRDQYAIAPIRSYKKKVKWKN